MSDNGKTTIQQSGWKIDNKGLIHVVIAFTVSTTVVWATVASFVLFISDSRITVNPDTRLKECPSTSGMNSGYRVQARTIDPPSGGQPEKPTVTLEGAGA